MSAIEQTSFNIALANMNAFRASGMAPFSGKAIDISCDLMTSAHGLLETLATGWETSDNVRDSLDHLGGVNPRIHASALRGIASLIALALYFGENA